MCVIWNLYKRSGRSKRYLRGSVSSIVILKGKRFEAEARLAAAECVPRITCSRDGGQRCKSESEEENEGHGKRSDDDGGVSLSGLVHDPFLILWFCRRTHSFSTSIHLLPHPDSSPKKRGEALSIRCPDSDSLPQQLIPPASGAAADTWFAFSFTCGNRCSVRRHHVVTRTTLHPEMVFAEKQLIHWPRCP